MGRGTGGGRRFQRCRGRVLENEGVCKIAPRFNDPPAQGLSRRRACQSTSHDHMQTVVGADDYLNSQILLQGFGKLPRRGFTAQGDDLDTVRPLPLLGGAAAFGPLPDRGFPGPAALHRRVPCGRRGSPGRRREPRGDQQQILPHRTGIELLGQRSGILLLRRCRLHLFRLARAAYAADQDRQERCPGYADVRNPAPAAAEFNLFHSSCSKQLRTRGAPLRAR